jgi:signal transduction histidine kinase
MPDPANHALTTRAAQALRALAASHPYAADAGLAALVLVAVSVPFVLPWGAGAPRPTWLGYVLAVGTAVPLIWRRRAPIACAVVVTAFTVALVLYHRPGQPMQYGAVVAVYTVASVAPRWQRIATVAVWCAGILVVGAIDDRSTGVGNAFAILTVLSAYGLGELTRVRRAYVGALEERARRIDWERQAEIEQAAARERARIAREMHDILAHAVSLMVVQAEAGPVAVRTDPDRASAAFDAIATAGRDAMRQLRQILSVLKDTDGAAERAPQPTVANLPELVERVERSGLRTELRISGEPRPMRPDVEVAAYRVVQEALTNTIKHAAAGCAVVRLEWRDDTLTIVVSDDGHGAVGHSDGHGQGLVGIRARVAACGGTAVAGPATDGGGFVVTAHLPAGLDGPVPASAAPQALR